MIAAIYARKSTEQTASPEQRSITRQLELSRADAAARGWSAGQEFTDDAISGAEFVKRKGLRVLMESLQPRPHFDVLVVYELSRLGRDQVRTLAAITDIVEAGVTIACVATGRQITSE